MEIALAPFSLLLIIALIAIIVFAIYMALYKRNVNKALQENNGKHMSLPDIRSMISIILIVVLFFSVFSLKAQTTNLQNNMDTFYYNTGSSITNLQNAVSNLNDTLTEIKNSSKLITDYNYEIQNFNKETLTTDLTFEINLRSFTDNTIVTISIGNDIVELTKSPSGKFTGSIEYSIFKEVTGVYVLVTENGSTQSEQLEDIYVDCMWYNILPCIKADYMGTPAYKNKKLYIKDDLYIYLNEIEPHYFTDVYVEIFADNKSVKTIDIDYSKNQIEYELTIDEVIDVKDEDSVIDIYVIGKDSAGLTHKFNAFSGNENSYITYDFGEDLYDSNGNKLTHYNID